jgi:hypothetical protein
LAVDGLQLAIVLGQKWTLLHPLALHEANFDRKHDGQRDSWKAGDHPRKASRDASGDAREYAEHQGAQLGKRREVEREVEL